jgi:hypothetical protein
MLVDGHEMAYGYAAEVSLAFHVVPPFVVTKMAASKSDNSPVAKHVVTDGQVMA